MNTNASAQKFPLVTTRVVVISDFNCPYCFTLNEWIHSFGASARVRWVGIEHRPDLPTSGANRHEDKLQMEKEVEDVKHRAPAVGIVSPSVWANSRSALLVQNALEDEEPEKAHAFRRRVFQNMWQEPGIPDMATIIEESLATFDLPFPELEPEWLDELTAWWKTHLDRVPCMIAPTGILHEGLQDQAAVGSFLNSALHVASVGPGCE